MSTRFVACPPRDLQDFVLSVLHFRDLPRRARDDVRIALTRIPPESQSIFLWAAEDAHLTAGTALERLAAVWFLNAAVNLADDLADGDCDYLEPRVGPGVAFLLQALALLPLARSNLTAACWEDCSIALTRAAAGQSLEVRGLISDAEDYLRIADAIAGQQYAAYFRLLWDGSELETRAVRVGSLIGRVCIVLTDLDSMDGRLFRLTTPERANILEVCRDALVELKEHAACTSVLRFSEFAANTLETKHVA